MTRRSLKAHPHPLAQNATLWMGVIVGAVVHVVGLATGVWQYFEGQLVVWPLVLAFVGAVIVFLSFILFVAPDDETENADHDLRPQRDAAPPERSGRKERKVQFQH